MLQWLKKSTAHLPKVSKLILNHGEINKIQILSEHQTSTNLTITITNKNLYDGTFQNGYLRYHYQRRFYTKRARTTNWFPVLAEQGKSLVLSGTAHNRSTWQFKTAQGDILTRKSPLPVKYNIEGDVFQDRTISKVNIPKEATAARVYFTSLDDDNTAILDNRMQIEYGKIPTHYTPQKKTSIKLPPLPANSNILYQEDTWFLIANNTKTKLSLPKLSLHPGDTITVEGSTNIQLIISYQEPKTIKKDGIYGVRWNTQDRNPVCERIEDAKDFRFNCVVEEENMTPFRNDFDFVYPWSEIKPCIVSINAEGVRSVKYEINPASCKKYSLGNVMIEIPKFYCKREQIGEYEYLSISPTKQDGFILDPSFLTKDGEIDHIYIGAYLSSIFKKTKLKSVTGVYPAIKKSMNQIRKLLENSNGFTECDLLAILTIQRLYLVETAVLDSQSIFEGNVFLPYLLKDKSKSFYAIESEAQTNRILVKNTKVTKRFHPGDSISILANWDEYYNIPGKYQREILSVKRYKKKSLEITFSGKPVDIVERETGITTIAEKSGRTDHLPYITGAVKEDSGHASFKYRGIENLWGTVFIFLDHAYVKNSELYITYPTGKTEKLNFKLPEQKVQLSPTQFGDPNHMIVRRMGYDKNQPLILFPTEIGNGATTSSYYCDAWYNSAGENVSYILCFGGAWDNKGYAGIFNFRATFTERSLRPYNGSRLILR